MTTSGPSINDWVKAWQAVFGKCEYRATDPAGKEYPSAGWKKEWDDSNFIIIKPLVYIWADEVTKQKLRKQTHRGIQSTMSAFDSL